MRACPNYESTVKTPAAAAPADHLWCLRCGNNDHATAKCKTADPPVNFPPNDGTRRGCLHCGIFGHEMSECLRRVPLVQHEQQSKISAISADHESHDTAIKQLQQDVKALQASHKIINECKSDLAQLDIKVNTLMTFKNSAEPQLQSTTALCTSFQAFLDNEWQPHCRKFQSFLDDEWAPVKHRFDDLLQRDLDTAPMKKPEDIFNVESSPELPSPDDDDDGDKDMPQARTTGKRSGAERSDPPTTPAKKRPSSGSTSRKWWVDLAPLAVERSTTAWHTELLDALLAEWSDSNMTRLQQWFSTHATDEMQATLDSLSTANTTKRALHSGLRTLLRGACVPPLIFSAHAPKSTQASSSTSLNDNRKSRH